MAPLLTYCLTQPQLLSSFFTSSLSFKIHFFFVIGTFVDVLPDTDTSCFFFFNNCCCYSLAPLLTYCLTQPRLLIRSLHSWTGSWIRAPSSSTSWSWWQWMWWWWWWWWWCSWLWWWWWLWWWILDRVMDQRWLIIHFLRGSRQREEEWEKVKPGQGCDISTLDWMMRRKVMIWTSPFPWPQGVPELPPHT